MHRLLTIAASMLLAGCTSIDVKPANPSAQITHVCIENNPKVAVSDFLDVLEQGFARHGISTEVFSGDAPANCSYTLIYTALRSWDFAPYLTEADIRLQHGGTLVASGHYHLNGRGGFSMMKWQGTKTKMDPVIDEMLKGNKTTSAEAL